MTSAEIEVHKEKVKQVMVAHLTIIGFPKITNEQIMSELKNMWVKIEEAGLIVPGMSFAAFNQIANDQYMIAQINEMMGL